MRSWVALVLSVFALVVALAGTSATEAAARAVRLALFANNAGAVNGIKASRTPKPGLLIPLTASRRFPAAVMPRVDAASVDGLSASQSPVAGKLLALGSNGSFDGSVIPRIAARVWSDAEQSIPLSATGVNTPETVVVFNRVRFDTDHLFDAGSPNRLTIPVAGIYLVTATVKWAGAALDQGKGDRVIRIVADNQRGGNQVASVQAVTAADPAQTITSVFDFATGDHVFLQVGAASDTKLIDSGGDTPSLAVVWLAPAP